MLLPACLKPSGLVLTTGMPIALYALVRPSGQGQTNWVQPEPIPESEANSQSSLTTGLGQRSCKVVRQDLLSSASQKSYPDPVLPEVLQSGLTCMTQMSGWP